MNWRRITTLVLTLSAMDALADVGGFAGIANQSPLTALFAATDVTGSEMPPAVTSRWAFATSLASHAVSDRSPDEFALFDGETLRTELRYERRAGTDWQVGFAVPWLRHSGGSLDSLIDEWHSLFSLPEGIRPATPNDLIDYVYERDGREILARDTRTGGIGDVTLHAARRVAGTMDTPLTLRLGLKLPTGDAARLTGSGGVDAQLLVGRRQRSAFGSPNVAVSYRAGIAWLSSAEIDGLPERRTTWLANADIAWRATAATSLFARIDAHGKVIDSDLKTFRPALQLSIGAARQFGDDFAVRVGFSEDLRVGASPDIVFRLDLAFVGTR